VTNIEEVAKRVGVSPSTVSRALRGQAGVSERTRKRVQEAATELRYTASRSASGLVTGRTRTIGVVVPYVARWFFGQVIAGAEDVLRSAGFDLLLYAVGDVNARKRFFRELPLRRSVDAVLVLALPLDDDEASALRELNVPLAMVGYEVEGFHSVRIDDRHGGTLAVRHLANLGHRNIALIYGKVESMCFTPPRERRDAYLNVLASQGIEAREDLRAEGGFTLAGGERAMGELLAAEVQPTAVFAQSDEMAMGALRALAKHGLSVPTEVSIVGFDGHEMSEFVDLTTIAQPVRDQGATAARLLLEQLASDVGSLETTDVLMPVELVVRGSTAALRNGVREAR
jgi:DNA-binding LacI/PurR family transcriptional regulator